jgi:hypothetical protein
MIKARGDLPSPKHLMGEEEAHQRYSREAIEQDYKDNVYYRQRKGGTKYFHGRVSKLYLDNYDNIFRKD